MRRFISWLIMIPTAVAVIVFALNNKEPIALNLWPFALVVEMELYLVLTAVLGAGVLLGGVVSWAGGGRLRAELRKQTYAGGSRSSTIGCGTGTQVQAARGSGGTQIRF